jgi:hypothetical protein
MNAYMYFTHVFYRYGSGQGRRNYSRAGHYEAEPVVRNGITINGVAVR